MTDMIHADVEVVYERLALGIDAAGADAAPVFLAKVALLLAREVGDRDRVLHLIDEAARDLEAFGGAPERNEAGPQ